MFKKILIANRGEIAVRIIRSCKELGIKTVAVYSYVDEKSLHVRLADEAIPLRGNTARETYLDFNKIINAAIDSGCEAIHPGYGFLSENGDFIELVEKSGIIFIGPKSRSVKMMGNKLAARKLMQENNVPVVPGSEFSIDDEKNLIDMANEIGYPILLKAAAGGGGKGMRIVNSVDELMKCFQLTQNEAEKAFKDKSIYIEKYIPKAKHIEVQIIADTYGNYRHIFERECSIQRRHQKIIEEAPSISINSQQREKLLEIAIKAAKACDYVNAGTIEFIFDGQHFYFLEMNTRIQVEHPVTEMITGIDIVKEQIRIAAGEEISFKQKDVKINGYAIEARIYAENPFENFIPSYGKIKEFRQPGGFGIRFETGIDQYSEVPIYYDPIIAKLIAWGRTREEARQRLVRALKESIISGVITNIPFNLWILENEDFVNNNYDTQYLSRIMNKLNNSDWYSISSSQLKEISEILSTIDFTQQNKFVNKSNNQKRSFWMKRRFE